VGRVYTELLAVGTLAGAGSSTVYTVPVGKRAVVRDIILYDGGAAAGFIGLAAVPPGGGSAVFLVTYPAAQPTVANHWEGRQVVMAGGSLLLIAGVTTADYRVTGYLFDEPV